MNGAFCLPCRSGKVEERECTVELIGHTCPTGTVGSPPSSIQTQPNCVLLGAGSCRYSRRSVQLFRGNSREALPQKTKNRRGKLLTVYLNVETQRQCAKGNLIYDGRKKMMMILSPCPTSKKGTPHCTPGVQTKQREPDGRLSQLMECVACNTSTRVYFSEGTMEFQENLDFPDNTDAQ